MKVPAPVLRVWVLLAILGAVIVGLMAGPLGIAWRSYDLWASGEHAGAVIVEKVGGFDFQVRIASGPRTGHECRVSPSEAIYDAKDMTCPECGSDMAEGYLAVLAGLHWRGIDQPIGMPHALSGLPGTVGWRGRPRLHGYRCESCSVVTFKYGKPA